MSDKPKTEVFRNTATGLLWAANPGTPAHDRMTRGVERGEFERASFAPQPKPTRGRRKADDDGTTSSK